MKKLMFCWLLVMGITSTLFAQNNWYVSPTGTPTGNGTQANPWDLQTALNHPASVLPGDTIWLLAGTYTGHFVSILTGLQDKYITVRGVKGQGIVELDGNIPINSPFETVLTVGPNSTTSYNGYTYPAEKSNYVVFRDFEVKCKGVFERYNYGQPTFKNITGIKHENGTCKFINLLVSDIPGIGIWSGSKSKDSNFYGNIVYNTGSYKIIPNITNNCTKSFEHNGSGFYIQNNNSDILYPRIFENNFIFNNLRINAKVYATDGEDSNYSSVQNVSFLNNTIFNGGTPLAYFFENYDNCNDTKFNGIIGSSRSTNLEISTYNKNNSNRTKNIIVNQNVLHHDSPTIMNYDIGPNDRSLSVGHDNTSTENINIHNNIITGLGSAVTTFEVKSINFTNNLVYGYRGLNMSVKTIPFINTIDWKFNYNKYFYDINYKFGTGSDDYMTFSVWKNNYSQDLIESTKLSRSAFNPDVKKIIQNKYEPTRFHVTIMNKAGGVDTNLDFSRYNIPLGTTYTVRDVENYHTILKTGTLTSNSLVITAADMDNPAFEKFTNYADPSHDRARKSFNNFGVFIIDFNVPCTSLLTFANQTETGVKNHQVSNKITFGSGYINETSAKVVAKAGQQIRWVPNTHIKAGSQLHAKIEACSGGLAYVGDAQFNPTGFTTSQNAREKIQGNYVMKVESGIQIYPNPTTDEFTFQSTDKIIAVHIFDLTGKLVYESSFEPTNKKSITVSNLTSAVYKVQLTDVNHQKTTHTLIKK